jgi:hypothetical protein
VSIRSLRATLSKAGSAAFATLIALPLAGQLLAPPRSVSALENRTLTAPPTLAEARADWPGFPARVSDWLEDRFGFRDQLLALYVTLDRKLQTGAARSAVRGDDGWLFATTADSLLSHQGRLPFAPGEAEAWLGRVGEIAAQAEASGAVFVVLIAPDKQTIYPERLSDYPRRFAEETRRETLVRRAPERGLALLSPGEALTAAKADGEVYYRTDTHWAPRGAYVAYRALIDALQEEGVAVEPLGEGRVAWRPKDGFVGDIYGLLGEANGAPETFDAAEIAQAATVVETTDLSELAAEGFRSRRITMAPRGLPSILVLGDSFADPLAPFLEQSFDEVTLIHHQFGGFPPEVIEPGRYDVVVLEMVERFLNRPLETP